ncbi:MAG: 16S rRNA processing protein RimM, partial [Pseudomonadales bacterium]|nr:ribosome maturation factor RimM [Gammaproteobacteria bacterium]NNL56171.1 16S rRNA processing protein RimM [Pseudomonadales bacterium]
FAGVDDREAAQRFSRHFVQVATTALPATTEGDYYWHQLEGLQVYQQATSGLDEFLLGEVDYLLATGANDVLVVRRDNVDGEGEGEVLIPFRPGAVVKSVDLASGRMLVDWYYDD